MKHRIASLRSAAVLVLSTAVSTAWAQTENSLPLLRMENDARTAALAGAGAALPDNPFAIYGNAAVALFGEKRSGAGVTAGALGSSGDDRLWNAAGFWTITATSQQKSTKPRPVSPRKPPDGARKDLRNGSAAG